MFRWLLVACLVGASAVRAHAQGDSEKSDVRCIVIGVQGSNVSDNNVRNASVLEATYFLGRFDSSGTKTPLIELVRKEVQRLERLSPAALDQEKWRCGNVLSARGLSLKEIGKALQQ